MISFTVLGEARPAGSKRAFPFKRRDGRLGVAVSDDNPGAKDWKRTIAWEAARVIYGADAVRGTPERNLLRGPLEVEFTFYRSRPKGHLGANGLTKVGRETPFPIARPDVLKLARAAEDALTGVLWIDDAQIVRETLRKEWGEPARLEIKVSEVSS